MNALVWIALVLIVIWLVAVVALKVVSLAIHLALLGAVLLLVAWAFRRGKGPVSRDLEPRAVPAPVPPRLIDSDEGDST